MFLEKFRSLVPKYLEDQWNEADGLSAGELADGLAEAKVKIPFVLEEFYLALGIVYRRNNAKGNWVSEEGTFSEFTLDMFAWVFEELAAELED